MSDPWREGPDHEKWCSSEVTRKILGEVEGPISKKWMQASAKKVSNLRAELQASFVGLDDEIDWLLATLIARENLLLLGSPGVAKSELATRTYHLLNLTPAKADLKELQALGTVTQPGAWWEERRARESQQQKYFHYLLSRFTQPEELFGPIEISLLRQGILARVNFGLLTGPGVRAAFLDEVFKASSSILNTLLTLTQERQYFNFGGMVQSDLLMLIAASNELPGGFRTGSYGAGSGLEDFQTLYAFLDRFPIRLLIPVMSGTKKIESTSHDTNRSTTALEEATRRAINRERQRFSTGANFHPRGSGMPCVNDLLLLGRACMQQTESPLPTADHTKFFNTFMKVATHLQPQGTKAQESIVTWTISPRKLRALYKIGVAHAVVRSAHSSKDPPVVSELNDKDLRVFDLIWDSPVAKDDLERQVSEAIKQAYFR